MPRKPARPPRRKEPLQPPTRREATDRFRNQSWWPFAHPFSLGLTGVGRTPNWEQRLQMRIKRKGGNRAAEKRALEKWLNKSPEKRKEMEEWLKKHGKR